MDADRIVREFCSSWATGDIELILAAFAEDAIYHNVPMPVCSGKTEIRRFLEGFLGVIASSVHFDIRHQLVSGNVVMNERVDTIVMEESSIALPVCGVFELRDDGKIAAWRDYFDMGQFTGG